MLEAEVQPIPEMESILNKPQAVVNAYRNTGITNKLSLQNFAGTYIDSYRM
jgi:hypothetical protein